MAELVLTTSRYTEPGVYIGEILNPEAANLSADARIPAIIAKGSRLAVAKNAGIIRAFLAGVQLNFTASPPFIAPLQHAAQGVQAKPNRIFKQDGTELRADQWQYILTGPSYMSVQIRDEVFDPLATYYIDYQSTDRSVQDQIPIAEIRQIRLVGNQVDRDQYKEYRDFYIPMAFTPVQADVSNVHKTPWVDLAINTVLQPLSTGSVNYDVGNAYTHNYDRNYQIVCLSASGVMPNRLATFKWVASLGSGGNSVQPPIPLNVADTPPQFTVDETIPASLVQSLDNGLVLDFAFGATQFVAGDSFSFTAHGPSLIEVDARYSNPQYASLAVGVVSGNAHALQVGIPPIASYLGTRNNKYRLKLLSSTGVTPNRVLTFAWARYGDIVDVASGNFSIQENNPASLVKLLTDGVQINFIVGLADADIGTQWDVVAQAPRLYYTAKDSRSYKLTVSTITHPASGVSVIDGGFSTDTTEGRFGIFESDFNSAGGAEDGYTILPDNVSIAFRNAGASYAALDIFTFGVMDSDLIDWSLKANVQEVKQLTDYQTDLNGAITGIAGQKYVILSQVPTDQNSIIVQDYNTGAPLSFNFNVGTPFIFFTSDPGVPIRITYTSRGLEPDPGQTYYMTILFLRPDSFYNNPFLVLRLDDGRNFAAPSTIDNDLYIGNEILWSNLGLAAYLVQPKNLDGSGVFSKPDFVNAITSVRAFPRISDLCLLNFPDALDQVLEENILGNDPFEQRPNLVWVGMPIGTPVGDENTAGSLVNMAASVLQVRGDSAAHGTRILVGSTRATKTVVLDSGQSSSVTLDGSFLALAAAATIASFADPATDILNTSINGFDSIDLQTKENNLILGQSQILYINGAPGAYTWGEDTTVDPSVGFDRIQLMTQRQFVTKVVIRDMQSLIGITPVSGAAAKQLIRGNLASILRGLLARGLIAQYQDVDGNDRAFDPQADIIVFQDQNDLTLFFFNYAWFSRNVIKRLFGLYALNSNDFSTGVALK